MGKGSKMELLKENERGANKAAAKVMMITGIAFVLVLILNIVGIFTVDLGVMVTAFVLGEIFLLAPTIVVNVLKMEGEWVKFVTVSCSVIFTLILTVTLSFHAVLLYIYPIAIASLFFSGKLNLFTTIATIIGVSAGQFMSYSFDFVSDHNLTDMKRVILFGIVPRAIILFCMSCIFSMLTKRTASMLGNLMGAEQQRIMQEKSLEVSRKLLETVTELDKISAASTEANRSITDETSNVMRDSDANFNHIRTVEDSMSQISESLKNLSDKSEQIAGLIDRANKLTNENDKKITLAYSEMDEICKGTDKSREIIGQLSEQSRRIVEITKMITDIATQTNILAINASIEASHAGAAGAGFAVVASEIKVLSEKTAKAATEIDEIIGLVTSNISNAVEAMEKNASLTRSGMESMEQIKLSAEQVSRSNSEVTENIGSMNSVIGNVFTNGESVSAQLISVSKNIESNCGAVQHVAAAIEESSAGTETLGTMVRDIKNMAQELEKLTV